MPNLNVALVVVALGVFLLQEQKKFVEHQQLSLPLCPLLANLALTLGGRGRGRERERERRIGGGQEEGVRETEGEKEGERRSSQW